MDKDNEVIMTVKEWAESSGLKLFDYDGFMEIYSKLSRDDSIDFESQIVSRFRNAGDLLCTRKAFISCLSGCTIQVPQTSQYEEMAKVIPEFVESNINMNIAFSVGQLKHYDLKRDELKTALEKMLNLLKYKANVREKCIEINKGAGETDISQLDETRFSSEDIEIIKSHEGTAESLEAKLSDEVIQSLEDLIQNRNPKQSRVPLQKIQLLSTILYSTARQRTSEKLEEEFMYLNNPLQKKEPFIKTYNIVSEEEIRPGVAFDIDTENGKVKGAMRTTPGIDAKIKKAIESLDETSKSLEVIDSEVSVEQRVSLKTRIREFAKKILDKIKRKNEGR